MAQRSVDNDFPLCCSNRFMTTDDESLKEGAGAQNAMARELGAADFRSETIEEICQLATVPWFPVSKRAADKDKGSKTSNELTGYEVSLVGTAKALARRVHENDHDALLRLFIMGAAAQLELWQLSKESKLLQRASKHSIFWFLPRSPFSGLGGLLKDFEKLLGIAALFLKFRKLKGNLDVPVNACAFKLLTFMVLAKRGLISNPRFAGWSEACSGLNPLSEHTWKEEWWKLGKDIAKDMFPDLDKVLFGGKADPQNKDRNFDAAIHHLGMAFKVVWPLVKGIEDATLHTTNPA
jgi:hypothetical protein